MDYKFEATDIQTKQVIRFTLNDLIFNKTNKLKDSLHEEMVYKMVGKVKY
jgi:hypothetical protein